MGIKINGEDFDNMTFRDKAYIGGLMMGITPLYRYIFNEYNKERMILEIETDSYSEFEDFVLEIWEDWSDISDELVEEKEIAETICDILSTEYGVCYIMDELPVDYED